MLQDSHFLIIKKRCKSVSSEIDSKSYICDNCEIDCKTRSNLFHHKKFCCSKNNLNIRKPCVFPDCKASFQFISDHNKHLAEFHNSEMDVKELTFSSMVEFQLWLECHSKETFSSFKKCSGSKHKVNKAYHYYCCHFTVTQKKKKPVPISSRKNLKGSLPLGFRCPSRILVSEEQDLATAIFYSGHNHELSFENTKFQQLSQNCRDQIKTYAQLGVSTDQIQEFI
ncbi:uncharacterized protein LOC118202465 [Stegodyphus dumicola]|uniref:uncharacterized protein LOC118202465 n=1 Tax=Stegodyphus dumicola TaxID=202533 RepID=UPI0015AC150C|nr:uncharacterized protein LOC118202465 [Stegodyphus dumicola]